MPKTYRINSYSYEFRNMPEENLALLYLREDNKLVCMLAFHDKRDEDIPPPREDENGIIFSVCRFSWLRNILDMLRKEKPVFLYWDLNKQTLSLQSDENTVNDRAKTKLLDYFFR